ncbi:hypothetical protein ES703_116601 [subsurface metagenome]
MKTKKERKTRDQLINELSRLQKTKTELQQAREIINQKLKLEKTISTISSRFVGASNFDYVISASLTDIGKLSGASRAYLFLFRESGTIMDNTHEWCAKGVTPEKESLQNLSCEMFPWWMNRLRKGEIIHIKDVSKLPPEAKPEKEILTKQGIKSILVFPVGLRKNLAGFMGFDNVLETREWSNEDLELLRITSEIIETAYERKQAEEEKEKLISELEEALTKIKTLSGLLPICANCKKIRDENGIWHQVEVYVRDHSNAEFTHGLCPKCANTMYRL